MSAGNGRSGMFCLSEMNVMMLQYIHVRNEALDHFHLFSSSLNFPAALTSQTIYESMKAVIYGSRLHVQQFTRVLHNLCYVIMFRQLHRLCSNHDELKQSDQIF